MIFMNKLIFLPLIFITSCGVFTWQTTINTLDGYFFGYERDSVSVDEFLESQYSFVSIKFGRAESVRLVLAFVLEDGLLEWRSADNISVFTKNGIIVKTDGLDSDFQNHNFSLSELINNGSQETKVSLTNPDLYYASALNTISQDKTLEIDYLDQVVSVTKFDHEIHLPTIKWKSRNTYYVDNSGNILLSLQEIHPMMPEMQLTFYYK